MSVLVVRLLTFIQQGPRHNEQFGDVIASGFLEHSNHDRAYEGTSAGYSCVDGLLRSVTYVRDAYSVPLIERHTRGLNRANV